MKIVSIKQILNEKTKTNYIELFKAMKYVRHSNGDDTDKYVRMQLFEVDLEKLLGSLWAQKSSCMNNFREYTR